VQQWRELSKAEQKSALEQAEKFFCSFASTNEIRQKISANGYEKFLALAQQQLAEMFDLPPNFSERAREGLLASLIECAAAEEEFGQPYADEDVARFHNLLLKAD
jgi:hypothetical protein